MVLYNDKNTIRKCLIILSAEDIYLFKGTMTEQLKQMRTNVSQNNNETQKVPNLNVLALKTNIYT